MIRERDYGAVSGLAALVVLLAAAGFCLWQLVLAIQDHRDPIIIACAIGFAFSAFLLTGLFVVNPNEAKVLQLFGQYVGTAKAPGLRFANPLYRKRTISQRVRNFESSIAARARIVEGAVGMVEMALDMLSKKNVVTLDEERKAAMVSNLLVVLCGERNTQPIVNAGTLHH